jgi:hypothetical protein
MRVPLALRLKAAAGKYLPFLKMAPPADRQKVFNYRPVRNDSIEWETSPTGETLLKVPRREGRRSKLLALWFRIPEVRKVELDEVGSFVWTLCDGKNTVESIVKQTSQQYKLNRREVEISVTTYLQMLAERNFIGFYQKSGKSK